MRLPTRPRPPPKRLVQPVQKQQPNDTTMDRLWGGSEKLLLRHFDGYHDMIRPSTTASVPSIMFDLVTVSAKAGLLNILEDTGWIGSRTINAKVEPSCSMAVSQTPAALPLRCEMFHGRFPEVLCFALSRAGGLAHAARPKAMLCLLAILICLPLANNTGIHHTSRPYESKHGKHQASLKLR